MTEAERDQRERDRGERLVRIEVQNTRLVADIADLDRKVEEITVTLTPLSQTVTAMRSALWMIASVLATIVGGLATGALTGFLKIGIGQ